MKFKTIILQSGNNTGIEVPPEVVEGLGGGKKPAVAVTVGSYAYRSSIAVMGGKFLIPLGAERRAESGSPAAMRSTLSWRSIPAARSHRARRGAGRRCGSQAFFETLSYSNKLRHVLSITDAKTPETRTKRIDKAMDMLRAGKK